MDHLMKNQHSTSGDSEEDTCTGDADDVASLCSWTTDQGDFGDDHRHGVCVSRLGDLSDVERHTAIPADVANQTPPVMTYGQHGIVPNNMAPPSSPSMLYVPMPMCYAVPMCYVVMPTTEDTAPWQSANQMQAQWSQNPRQQWVKSRSRSGQSWATQSQTSTGYSTPQRAENRKSHSNRIGSPEGCGTSQCSDNAVTTTVILRNLPTDCMRDVLLQILDDEGFSGKYDFLHVPTDFQTKVGLGYALLNLVTHEVAVCVQKHFEGFATWPCRSNNVCEVAWNSPHQGLETYVDRYRNSPLMHSSVPEAYRPVLFQNGVRIKFPAPTTRIRAPRIRHQKPSKGQVPPGTFDMMAAVYM